MSFVKRDAVPEIRAAGKIFETPAGGISAELQQVERPPTPVHVKPFRKSFFARVGQAGRHFGLRNDAPAPDMRFGRRNEYDSSASECLNPQFKGDRLNALSAANAEKNYLSSKREPLGRSAEPICEVPEKAKKDGFGIKSDLSESAKAVIYSCSGKYDEGRDLHAPGEQKTRNYNWAKVQIDPTKFRFGSNTAGNPITTKELFTPPVQTAILPKIVSDFKSVTSPALGATRNLGFGSRPQTVEFEYGKTIARDRFGAREILSGMGEKPALEDATLGRPVCRSALLRKLRQQDSVDASRVFGCPTVRLDLTRPKSKKVTDGNNYGDDVGASALLYPNLYTAKGVEEDTFATRITLEQAKSLNEKLSFGLSDAQVSAVYEQAARSSAAVTYESFRTAIDELKL